MRLTAVKLVGVLVAVSATTTGCNCGGRGERQLVQEFGEIALVDPNKPSQVLEGREVEYDFGQVAQGNHASVTLTLRNPGRGRLTLEYFEHAEGEAVMVGTKTVGEGEPPFEIAFDDNTEVPAGGSHGLMVTFRPPMRDEKIVPHFAKLTLHAANAKPDEDTAVFILRGNGVANDCAVPALIDFGTVAIGQTYEQGFSITNGTPLETTATIETIEGDGKDAYYFALGSISVGQVTLPAQGKRTVSLVFNPRREGEFHAAVPIRLSEQCPLARVSLVGKAVPKILVWTPASVDFGYVAENVKVDRQIQFQNLGNVDVILSQFRADTGEGFIVPTGLVTVPARGGRRTITVSFRPPLRGRKDSDLMFTTNLVGDQATVAIPMTGYCGGPDIEVVPLPTLSFGKVAFFSGTPTTQSKRIIVRNVGTVATDPKENLKLGKGGAGAPYAVLTAKDGSPATPELSLTVASTYDPTVGLEAVPGKNSVELTVKLAAKTTGRKEAKVTIWSNDPDEPEVVVNVVADVETMQPCSYTVAPSTVNFGVVTPPDYKDLTVAVSNLSQTNACIISNVDVGPGSHDAFSLPGGEIGSHTLGPQQTLKILVRVRPLALPAAGTSPQITGTLQFGASSPTAPVGTVNLQATVAAGCLTIAPDDVAFGSVKTGCSSATRPVAIYNTCSTTLTIKSFTMQSAAGQSAGGPNCPGTSACPEFQLVTYPTNTPISFPAGATPLTFSVKYKPIDLGKDSGAVAIEVQQGAATHTYVVTLTGTGDTMGKNVDTFTQAQRPKADILLDIDDSGSMGSHQTSLSQNFGAFIDYAVKTDIDYQLGVITTDDSSANRKGKLIGDDNNPRVLKPTSTSLDGTKNVADLFKEKTKVGTSGDSREQHLSTALKALTAPLITSDNLGFLRDDANLAIVVVTDTYDQSPQPWTFFLNSYLNIKGFNRANMFTFNVIGSFYDVRPAGCSYDDGPDQQAVGGAKFAPIIAATQGVKEEICTPDWAKSLEKLGKVAFGYRTNFFLNGRPDTTKPITVTIGGANIPEILPDGTRVWRYDPVANSVNFEPMFIPEAGETMNITYNVACN